jgi:hypothetical protein
MWIVSVLPASARGTSARSRSSVVVVAASCGPVVGNTSATSALPSGLSTGGVTPATPGWLRAEATNAAKRAWSAGLLTWPTTSRGPLNPGPNPRAGGEDQAIPNVRMVTRRRQRLRRK